MVSKNLSNSCILYIKNTALYMSFNIITSFNGDYVNFWCHKEMSVKIYIHHKMISFSNRVYFVFAKASTVQSENNTVLLWSYIGRDR